jgi:hypothetical protein
MLHVLLPTNFEVQSLAAAHLFEVAKLTIHYREEKVWLSGLRHCTGAAPLFPE